MSLVEYFKEKGHQIKEFEEGLAVYTTNKNVKEPHVLLSILHVNPEFKAKEGEICKKFIDSLAEELGVKVFAHVLSLEEKARDLLKLLAIDFKIDNITGNAAVLIKRL